MPNSSNGYPVLSGSSKGPQPRVRKIVVPTTKRHFIVRDGSCGFLLVHLAMWYDQTIEPLDKEVTWDDWGFASRVISGSSIISNHASGTAIDINAVQHPMGVSTRKTFSQKEITTIHKRLAFYNECIRWGGDYQNRPDAMHFEIVRPIGDVEKRARQLCTSPRGKSILKANPGLKKVIFS